MPASTSKGYPYPLTSDAFLPASVDFPALANAIETKSAREVATVLSASALLDVGVLGQIRAGRELAATDFTTLLGLGTPVGLWDAGSLTNLGSGGNLTNKGSVPLTAKGINGTANHAALFAGSTGQALYVADTGAADPFRIKTGTFGGWTRTAKRGAQQAIVSKLNDNGANNLRAYFACVNTNNHAHVYVSSDGTHNYGVTSQIAEGVTDVADDRWHFIVGTFDGSVLRLYVDGALEASAPFTGTMFASTAPFNIGGSRADGATAADNAHYGRVAVPFVTPDVLDETQIRKLMAAKVAHGYAVTPTRAHVALRKRKRGGSWVNGDFTAAPRRRYPGGSLVDGGLDGQNGAITGALTVVAGPDGAAAGAYQFPGGANYITAGLGSVPVGTASRTALAWFKTSYAASSTTILAYNGLDWRLLGVDAAGLLRTYDGTTDLTSIYVADGQWHLGVVVIDNSAGDGLKRKLYCDGRLVASSTALASTGAATGVMLGARSGALETWVGGIGPNAITDYAMAQDEITSLFSKGSVALGAQPSFDDDRGLEQIVQGMDATNVYVLGDVRKTISGKVNSDGSIAESVGGDFRVVKTGTGTYAIYWPARTWSTPPSIRGTVLTSGNYVSSPDGGTELLTTVHLRNDAGSFGDFGFTFDAIGRGPIDSQHQVDLRVAA